MIDTHRKTLKYKIKMTQRDLSVLDRQITKMTKVNDGKLNIPVGNINSRVSLLFKIRKLRNKLRGLQS